MSALLTASLFLDREARLLERHLFAARRDGVVSALRAYQNADGGFGHGLEPDKRCPASLPIDVEIAFQALATAGVAPPELLGPACDYLTTVTIDGAVPLAFPVIEDFPRAAHWTDWTYAPGVNPTAGLAGLLHRLDFDHPWRTAATSFCWNAIDSGKLPDEAHGLSEVLVFLAHVPDRDRAQRAAPAVLDQLTAHPLFHRTPNPGAYGLTPLHVAPTVGSPWRAHFTEDQLGAHLDHLAAAQQEDGGWPVTWEPPSAASKLEWRGMVTLQAINTLVSYGRI
ncbi:hypothetical protein [Actinoplanes derwentensis]|uniref:Prenyltransferase and squalene oxidase repeat-containing protein n=1 Tax=Actinoplanes derwentensis TaxID=113562 RepID=A0A1H1T9P7_9ACTN|nr:hypothetical protein [Actinoplanes derwentensis]GID89024.1 hypothetical protein Ade03nite_79480 [Actinoplanes derwentensis]SDS56853.1 hypothetical protein SAMN04489716_1075 [Actinoplanes derwentensis]